MSLGKTVKIGYEWKRITLTEEERQRVMQALVEINAQEFKRCLDTAKNISKEDFFNIAVVLFDKQGIAAFTALSEALEIKVHRVKQTPQEKALEKQATEKAETQLAEPPPAPKPERSAIDESMEKAEKEVAEKKEEGVQKDLKDIKEEVEKPPLPTPPSPPERAEAVDIEEKPKVTTTEEGGVTYETREIDLPEPDKQTQEEAKEAADDVFGKEWDSEQGKLVDRKKTPAPSHPDAFKEVE